MAIGAPLGAARGPSHPKCERTSVRVRELASQIGESPELPRLLVGVAMAYYAKGDLATAAEVAQAALAPAERTGEAFELLSAHYQVGQALLFQGHFSWALQHFQYGMKVYNPSEHGSLAYTVGFDRGVSAHAQATQCHLYLGHPDRALALSEKAVALAKRVEHPISRARSLVCWNCPWPARRAQSDVGTRRRSRGSRRAARVSVLPGSGKVPSRLCAGRIGEGRGGHRGDAAGDGRAGWDRERGRSARDFLLPR